MFSSAVCFFSLHVLYYTRSILPHVPFLHLLLGYILGHITTTAGFSLHFVCFYFKFSVILPCSAFLGQVPFSFVLPSSSFTLRFVPACLPTTTHRHTLPFHATPTHLHCTLTTYPGPGAYYQFCCLPRAGLCSTLLISALHPAVCLLPTVGFQACVSPVHFYTYHHLPAAWFTTTTHHDSSATAAHHCTATAVVVDISLHLCCYHLLLPHCSGVLYCICSTFYLPTGISACHHACCLHCYQHHQLPVTCLQAILFSPRVYLSALPMCCYCLPAVHTLRSHFSPKRHTAVHASAPPLTHTIPLLPCSTLCTHWN